MLSEKLSIAASLLLYLPSAHAGLSYLDAHAYDRQVVNNDLSLVLFTANGCGACDQVHDVLFEAQHSIPEMPIGVLNCFEEPKTCDEAAIFAVPKLMLSVGEDQLVPYSEGLNVESIVNFARRQTGSPIHHIASLDYEHYANATPITVVASIAADDETSQRAYLDIAQKWRRHFAFALTEDPSLGVDGTSKQPWLMLLKPFDERRTPYHGPFQQTEIETFLLSASLPLIGPMDPVLYDRYVENGIPLAQILCPPDECYELAATLYPLADRLRSRMAFITVNTVDYPTRGTKLGFDESHRRGFAIEDVQTTRAFPMATEDMTLETIEDFVMQYLNGSVEPVIRSAPPVREQTGHVMRLVGSNFDAVALDRGRDVLALLEVPWCEYCQDLHAVFEDLSMRYTEQGQGDKLAVVIVDVDANYVPTRIEQYPTIRLWRAHDNAVRSFNGTYFSMLTVEEVSTFLREEGGHALELLGTTGRPAKDEL